MMQFGRLIPVDTIRTIQCAAGIPSKRRSAPTRATAASNSADLGGALSADAERHPALGASETADW